MKVVAAIDGDLLCYRAAAAAEKRHIIAVHKQSRREKRFKTRTEFWGHHKKKEGGWLAQLNLDRMMDNKPLFLPDDFEIIDGREAESVEGALHSIRVTIEKICDAIGASEVEIYLSGKSNFRDNIPLPTRYKSNREFVERPILLDECRDYVKRKYKTFIADGMEADDMLVIRAYNVEDGERVVVCSLDKDNRQASGTAMFDWTKDFPEVEELPDFGSLWRNDKGEVKFNGQIGMFHQMLYGDPTDCYKPCEIAGLNFGEVGSYNLLKDCTTYNEALKVVHDTYQKWYPDIVTFKAWDDNEYSFSYLDIWQMYADCVVMRRHPTYRWDVRQEIANARIF